MDKPVAAPRRYDAEAKRRRVLDAVVATITDIGYYKASSNEIARRAGVTWGSIQHLFGSREELMLDVVNDIGSRTERLFADAPVEGDTLEERLASVMSVLAQHYERDSYLVQMQILLELSSNPKMAAHSKIDLQRRSSQMFDRLAQPLIAKAIGQASKEQDLVLFTFQTLRSYLSTVAVGRRISEMPEGTVLRLIGTSQRDEPLRDFLVRGVACVIREEMAKRGYSAN
jgi:AcrR family transcriptional regulator